MEIFANEKSPVPPQKKETEYGVSRSFQRRQICLPRCRGFSPAGEFEGAEPSCSLHLRRRFHRLRTRSCAKRNFESCRSPMVPQRGIENSAGAQLEARLRSASRSELRAPKRFRLRRPASAAGSRQVQPHLHPNHFIIPLTAYLFFMIFLFFLKKGIDNSCYMYYNSEYMSYETVG